MTGTAGLPLPAQCALVFLFSEMLVGRFAVSCRYQLRHFSPCQAVALVVQTSREVKKL